jgi:hypothetical protein
MISCHCSDDRYDFVVFDEFENVVDHDPNGMNCPAARGIGSLTN